MSLDYCAHNLIRLTYRHPDCSRCSRLDGARVEPQKPWDPPESLRYLSVLAVDLRPEFG